MNDLFNNGRTPLEKSFLKLPSSALSVLQEMGIFYTDEITLKVINLAGGRIGVGKKSEKVLYNILRRNNLKN